MSLAKDSDWKTAQRIHAAKTTHQLQDDDAQILQLSKLPLKNTKCSSTKTQTTSETRSTVTMIPTGAPQKRKFSINALARCTLSSRFTPHQLPHVLGYLDASTHVGLRRLQAAWKGTSSAFRAREELYKCEISGEALWRSVGKSSLLGYTLYSNGTEDALEPLKCWVAASVNAAKLAPVTTSSMWHQLVHCKPPWI